MKTQYILVFAFCIGCGEAVASEEYDMQNPIDLDRRIRSLEAKLRGVEKATAFVHEIAPRGIEPDRTLYTPDASAGQTRLVVPIITGEKIRLKRVYFGFRTTDPFDAYARVALYRITNSTPPEDLLGTGGDYRAVNLSLVATFTTTSAATSFPSTWSAYYQDLEREVELSPDVNYALVFNLTANGRLARASEPFAATRAQFAGSWADINDFPQNLTGNREGGGATAPWYMARSLLGINLAGI